MNLRDTVDTIEQLEAMYRPPGAGAAGKVLTAINDGMAAFIDRCPLIVVATTDGHGNVDASPRGGPPGFVRRLDDRHVAIPDLNGNNRLDSLRNIVAHRWAGLLMMVPGKEETLRINGPATLTIDPEILAGFTQELRTPKLAIVVETVEIFGHCAKAFRRAGAWQPDTWQAVADAPDLATMYACHWNLDEQVVRDGLEASYVADLAAD
jgi:PPOX class probable FMN-dependent enzyme